MARRDEESDSIADETVPEGNPSERPPVAALEVGMVLGARYYLEALLGRGGSGVVYRGADRVLGETVAIKILYPERARHRSWIKRLFREVKVARAIRHANVCRVFELGEADGHWFITMELASGTLHQRLQEAAPRPWAERLEDARAVCNGLSAIHAVGITHRDVTPQNVLRMPDGRLVISDFGLALANKESTTMYGGTPNYIPPEVLGGNRSDQRSDVWQLGVVLHEILFGRRPIWKQKGERSILQPPVSTVDDVIVEELARLCVDCLSSDPAQRPASAVSVAGRLAAAEVARPRGWLVRRALKARSWVRRRRVALMSGLAVALLAAGTARFIEVARRPGLCRGAPERTAIVWNATIKSKMASAFRATGKLYAGDALSGVTGTLDDYIRRWTGMYVEACQATHVRGDQSAEVLDLRMTCLGDRLEEVGALAKVLAGADATVVENAVKAAAGIRPLDHCADVRALRSGVQPPKDTDLRRQVDILRPELVRIRTLFDTGAWTQADEEADRLVLRVRKLGYAPLLGQALLAFGVTPRMARAEESQQALEEAAFVAEASRDDETLAEACAHLVFVTGYYRGKYEVAEMWARRADAILARMGDNNPILRSWLLNNIAVVRSAQGRHQEALTTAEKALALKTSARGAQHFDVAVSLANVALFLHRLGRNDEALEVSSRAQAVFVAALGPEHPWLARILGTRAEVLLALGRIADGRADVERGLVIARRETRRDPAAKADLLATLGSCQLAEGDAESASKSLQESLQLFQEINAPAQLTGRPLFDLAKATWHIGNDRIQAVRHAAQARDNYGRVGLAKEAREIDEWLSSHRPPRK